MIRCSDLLAICLPILLPMAGHSQTLVEDAFGFFRPDADTPDRAQWSGLQTGIGDEGTWQTLVNPGPVETVTYILGPKRLVAGKDKGNGVAIVLDEWGNPVNDGEMVQFRIGSLERSAFTNAGIADFLFVPPVHAGQYFSGATTATRQSTRAEIAVTADLESVMPAMLFPAPQPLSHEALSQVGAGNLTDRFGNTVEDGIAMKFDITLDDGSFSQAGAVTQRGQANADILTRDIGGRGQVRGSLAAHVTRPQEITVTTPTALGAAEVTLTPVPDIGVFRLRVGPFRTQEGFALNDGSPVKVKATDSSGASVRTEGWLSNGYFETLLPAHAESGPVTLEISTSLGVQHTTMMSGNANPLTEEVAH